MTLTLQDYAGNQYPNEGFTYHEQLQGIGDYQEDLSIFRRRILTLLLQETPLYTTNAIDFVPLLKSRMTAFTHIHRLPPYLKDEIAELANVKLNNDLTREVEFIKENWEVIPEAVGTWYLQPNKNNKGLECESVQECITCLTGKVPKKTLFERIGTTFGGYRQACIDRKARIKKARNDWKEAIANKNARLAKLKMELELDVENLRAIAAEAENEPMPNPSDFTSY